MMKKTDLLKVMSVLFFLLAIVFAGGCANTTMMLYNGDTEQPISQALAVIEMKASYEMPDPVPGLLAQEQYQRYRARHHIHGWKDSPPLPLVSGGLPGYSPMFPINYNLPDELLVRNIEPKWEVITFRPIPLREDADYQAVMYYILKPGFLPMMLDPRGLNLLKRNGQINLRLPPNRTGFKESDDQTIHVIGNLLGVAQHPHLSTEHRRLLLQTMRDLLLPIQDFATEEPYPEFPKNRAEANMLLGEIQRLL